MKIAIFASGRGSNAQSIVDYFKYNEEIKVDLIVSNNASAGVLEIAKKEGISSLVMNKTVMEDDQYVLSALESIDIIVLAGYMRKIPAYLIQAFKDRIINIHPALLPKFGGKGMYGMNVHVAVKEQGEKESGITIHLVDEVYDNGAYLFQAKVALDTEDTAEEIASKVLALEHFHYPRAIESYISSLK